MDISIEKLLDDKVSSEEKEAIKATLTPDQQVEFAKEAKKVFEATLAQAAGARKEKNRVDELIEEKNKELGKVNETMDKFRGEQVDKAKARIVEKYKLDGDDLKVFEETFAKLDSGKVDADLIYQDALKAFVATKPEAFLAAQQSEADMAKAAAEATAREAQGKSAPPAGSEPPKYSQEVTDFAKKANISEADAAAFQVNGGRRILE